MAAATFTMYRKIPVNHGTGWGARSKVVDEHGHLLPVFRGQHGLGEHWDETQLGSLSFGTALAASHYALYPNDSRLTAQAPKVFPVYLNVHNPFIDCPDDPFMDLSHYATVFGFEETCRIAVKFKDYVYHTNAWEEVSETAGVDSVEALIELRPALLGELIIELYALLDDVDEVARLRAKGFDGAIHGGSGETAMEPEYRVFSTDQVCSIWDRRFID